MVPVPTRAPMLTYPGMTTAPDSRRHHPHSRLGEPALRQDLVVELDLAGLVRLQRREGEVEIDGLLQVAVDPPSLGSLDPLGDAQDPLVEAEDQLAHRPGVAVVLEERPVLHRLLDERAQLSEAGIGAALPR